MNPRAVQEKFFIKSGSYVLKHFNSSFESYLSIKKGTEKIKFVKLDKFTVAKNLAYDYGKSWFVHNPPARQLHALVPSKRHKGQDGQGAQLTIPKEGIPLAQLEIASCFGSEKADSDEEEGPEEGSHDLDLDQGEGPSGRFVDNGGLYDELYDEDDIYNPGQ